MYEDKGLPLPLVGFPGKKKNNNGVLKKVPGKVRMEMCMRRHVNSEPFSFPLCREN